MPSQANIVVKKNDGTTDITYTAVQPSSGDGVQAIWKSQTVGTAPVHQPELRCSTRSQSGKIGRAAGRERESSPVYIWRVVVRVTRKERV
jgi:hypothetical protein